MPVTTFNRPVDVVAAFAEALKAKDVDALGSLFSDDAEFVNILGMRMRRREGIVAGHARHSLPSRLSNVRLTDLPT